MRDWVTPTGKPRLLPRDLMSEQSHSTMSNHIIPEVCMGREEGEKGGGRIARENSPRQSGGEV